MKSLPFSRTQISLGATILVFAALCGLASWRYDGFASRNVFVALLGDNAFWGWRPSARPS